LFETSRSGAIMFKNIRKNIRFYLKKASSKKKTRVKHCLSDEIEGCG